MPFFTYYNINGIIKNEGEDKYMKKILKEMLPYIIILLTVILIRVFIVTPITVVGDSMVPYLHSDELLLLSKISYKIHDIKRFDIVVIKDDEWIIKRVIGLPGEKIFYYNNNLYVNGNLVEDKYGNGITNDFDLDDICLAGSGNTKANFFKCPYDTIPEGYYLVLGDNREISKDSRRVGLIKEEEIQGKAVFRFWPFNKIGSI